MQGRCHRRCGDRSHSLNHPAREASGSRVRRVRSLFFRLRDAGDFDIESLLRGRLEVGVENRFSVISPLTGEETLLTAEEVQGLLAIPDARWASTADHDASLVDAYARRGLVVTDGDDEDSRALRRRDDELARGEWHPLAAVFHMATRWRDETVGAFPESVEPETSEAVEQLLATVGPPPPHFHEVGRAAAVCELPVPRLSGGLADALAARRTSRAFARDATLDADLLSALLAAVFGCRGTAPLHEAHLVLKKTSPSGGALHPIEAYPLLAAVDGYEPGLYHYRTRDHALEMLEPLGRREAHTLAERFMCGQTALAGAQVHIVLTARFRRSFWKYRNHEKAYPALWMEAGHLSQTLYLVASHLGLGAFVTAAVNNANIDERLGLNPLEEGALAILGVGVRSREPTHLEPVFEPYTPR